MIEFAQMDPNDTLDTFSRWVVFDIFWYFLALRKWSNLTIIFLKWVGSTTKLELSRLRLKWPKHQLKKRRRQKDVDVHWKIYWREIIQTRMAMVYDTNIDIYNIYIYVIYTYLFLVKSSMHEAHYTSLNDFCVVNFGGSIYKAFLRKGCITFGIEDLPWK